MSDDVLTLPDGTETEIDPTDVEVIVDELGSITAHANKAQSRLIERFQKPVYVAITRAVGDELQEAENMLWNVLLSRYIDHAEGVSLNYLGNRVGEPRQSQNDPDYRVRIRARILINRSRGGPEDLYAIARALGLTVKLTNTGNASLRMDVLSYSANGPIRRQAADLLGEAVSGGVRLHVTAPTHATDAAVWGSVSDPSIGASFGSVSDPDAGAGLFGHSRMV